jgi:putative sigma-54 modulation protein
MQVTVTFRHVRPTQGLRRHATEKAERVRKFLRRPTEVQFILSVVKRRHIAEVLVNAKGLSISATEETEDLYSAIDGVMAKVERRIKRQVARQKKRKGKNDAVVTQAVEPLERRRIRIIPAKRIPVKPMSVDEAVLQLGLLDDAFLLFRNAANETLNVIYRRKDGNFGLIEPDLS